MTRGTTPSYIITIKDFSNLEGHTVEVTFKQNDLLVTLSRDDVEIKDNKVSVFLTQSQTLLFKSGTAKMQVRGIDSNGTAWASNIISVPVNPILRNGEIEHE